MRYKYSLGYEQGYNIDSRITGMWNDTGKIQVSMDYCHTKKSKYLITLVIHPQAKQRCRSETASTHPIGSVGEGVGGEVGEIPLLPPPPPVARLWRHKWWHPKGPGFTAPSPEMACWGIPIILIGEPPSVTYGCCGRLGWVSPNPLPNL